MDQKERHEVSEEFRKEIVRPAERREAIRNLAAKKVSETYDEADVLRIKILFSKVGLTEGCEKEYLKLIVRLHKDNSLRELASEFYRRWNA